MQKKLAIVGNSLALVIDKPLRRMLGLRPDAMVRVTIDGRRLIVEPVDQESPRAASPRPPSTAHLDTIAAARVAAPLAA